MKTLSALDIARLRMQRQLLGNPLRGLTPELLAGQLESFHAGDLRAAAQTWDTMERRNPMVGSVARKRYKSVSRLEWQILTVEDSQEAQAQKQVLEQFWNGVRVTDALDRNRRGGVAMLVQQAARCIGHRWAVHEIVWEPAPGRLGAKFTLTPLWFFENRTGELRFLPGDFALSGQELEPAGWLVHSGDGLMEATSVLVSQISLALGDWLAYSEKFGIPGLAWETAATPGSTEWDQAVEAAGNFGSDWSAVVSAGTKITPVNVSAGSSLPQQQLVDYLERRIVTLWRGADLGTMSQGQGGVGASLQGDETEILSEDDVATICEPLHEQVERHVLQFFFGAGVRPLAYFSLLQPEADSTERDLQIDETLTRLGVPLAVAATAERYGRAVAAEGEATLQSPHVAADPAVTSTGNCLTRQMLLGQGAQAVNEAAVDATAEALATTLAPLRERLREISKIEDPARAREALIGLRMEIPRMLRSAGQNAAVTRAFERVLGEAMISGLLTTPGDN